MKLKFDISGKFQPDPFIFEDGDKLYIYVTGRDGVGVYSATDLFGIWHYEGICYTVEGRVEFWAPSVIKLDGKYYLYASSSTEEEFEYMQVAVSDSPTGPFVNKNCLYNYFFPGLGSDPGSHIAFICHVSPVFLNLEYFLSFCLFWP